MDLIKSRLEEFRRIVKQKRGFTPADQLLPTSKNVIISAFTTSASKIYSNITAMNKFILSQKQDYIDIHRHISSQASSMTDTERLQLEVEVVGFTRDTMNQIGILEKRVDEDASNNDDVIAHRSSLILILRDSLRSLTDIFNDMRDHHNNLMCNNVATKIQHEPLITNTKLPIIQFDQVPDQNNLVDNLSPEEQKQLQEEGGALLEELEEEIDLIREAELKMDDISSLMHDFSVKLLEQNSTIENIYGMTVNSSNLVSKGNNELEEATSKGVDARILVMIVFIILSFSLIFIDWMQ